MPRALAPIENGLYRLAGVDPAEEQAGSTTRCRCSGFTSPALWRCITATGAASAAAQSAAIRCRLARSGVEHRRQLRHQYKLAVLRRRNDAQLFVADGGDHGPVVPLRRHRHCRRHRADAGLCPPLGADDRQFLGRYDADHALCAAADLHRRVAVPGLAGRAADARAHMYATTLEGANQVLARGPVASQKAIKLLSGDGGGFFNANSAHPSRTPPR